MSILALSWAWDQSPATSTEKLVLVFLADTHNEATGLCFPSITTIAKRTCTTERTVLRALSALEAQGYLTRLRATGRVTQYRLHRAAPVTDCHRSTHQPGEATHDTGVTGVTSDKLSPVSPCQGTHDAGVTSDKLSPVSPCQGTHDTGDTHPCHRCHPNGKRTGK